jgi:ADP-heptose:LPS heptosyltransferase
MPAISERSCEPLHRGCSAGEGGQDRQSSALGRGLVSITPCGMLGKLSDRLGLPYLGRNRMPNHILVIRLGALGDLVLSFQAMHEIREAHKDAKIALLTMPAFGGFARRMPWFDRIIVDPRPPFWRLDQWLKLRVDIQSFAPQRIYDLQNKRRQSALFALLGGPIGPEWSGAAPFCSHPRPKHPTPGTHFTEYVSDQLRRAGVRPRSPADVSWLSGPLDGYSLPECFAVLVPGCSPHREYKRWPPCNFAALADKLQQRGIASIAVGTVQDSTAIARIRCVAPYVIDFSGRTDLFQLASLARHAVAVIGNDTGPIHLAAVVGAPTISLISDRVDPMWTTPRGTKVKALQGAPLAELSTETVLLALDELLDQRMYSGRPSGER